MQTQSIMFEIETVQEIWRTSTSTLTILYTTSKTAVIKGLRGEFNLIMYRELERLLKEKGVVDVYFERKKNNEFYLKHVSLCK